MEIPLNCMSLRFNLNQTQTQTCQWLRLRWANSESNILASSCFQFMYRMSVEIQMDNQIRIALPWNEPSLPFLGGRVLQVFADGTLTKAGTTTGRTIGASLAVPENDSDWDLIDYGEASKGNVQLWNSWWRHGSPLRVCTNLHEDTIWVQIRWKRGRNSNILSSSTHAGNGLNVNGRSI